MAHATTIILSLSPQILGAERSHVCVYTFSFEVIQLALRSHNGHILNTYHLFSNKYYLRNGRDDALIYAAKGRMEYLWQKGAE